MAAEPEITEPTEDGDAPRSQGECDNRACSSKQDGHSGSTQKASPEHGDETSPTAMIVATLMLGVVIGFSSLLLGLLLDGAEGLLLGFQ